MILLTNAEIMDINQNHEWDSAIGYARAIEAAVLHKLSEQESPKSEWISVDMQRFLTDVVTAAGLLRHGKTDKELATRISDAAYNIRMSPPEAK